MKKLYDLFERKVLIGNRKLQWLYESLHRFSLRGMNYDQAGTITESGELYVIGHLAKKLNKNNSFVFFDVGANRGDYSKALINKFRGSKVYSFEPLPSTFGMLKKETQSFENIYCINKALGAQEGRRKIYSDGAGSGLSSFFPLESQAENKSHMEEVCITTLDSFCSANEIRQIDFLKIDVEGFEFEVLKGAETMIKSNKIRNIQFEFGGNHVKGHVHFFDIFQFLSNNYTISRVLRDGFRLYDRYDKQWEVYHTANYLAELKNI